MRLFPSSALSFCRPASSWCRDLNSEEKEDASLGYQGALSWESHDVFSRPCNFPHAGPLPDKPLSAWDLILVLQIPAEPLLPLGSFPQMSEKVNNSFSEHFEHISHLTLNPLQVYLSVSTEELEFLEGKETCLKFLRCPGTWHIAGTGYILTVLTFDLGYTAICCSLLAQVTGRQAILPCILSAIAKLLRDFQFLSSVLSTCCLTT